MKLSRRCFLSFVVGGAAGTALSPLPWKLLDDVSIWSQNWPWVPVPPDGAADYINSTCMLCPGGCGISVRKIDDRVVKIEGAADHPINNGGICMLGLSGAQLLYSPTRVPTPLKRVGERGQGQWRTISWSEAVSELASKLTDIRAQGKPQSVACIAAKDTGTVSRLLQRFLSAYGSPNFIRMPSVNDAYEAVLRLTQGSQGYAGVDVENADFILSFGCAILDGYGSPVRMFQANSTWKEKHATLVQIEPRLSNTAAKSDHWVPIPPGTEADLALALAQVIIAKGRYHHDFINMHTEGFDAFTKMLNEKYTPEAVAGLVGLDAAAITDLAVRFMKAGKPLALLGRGKGQSPGSLKEALAVHSLNALMGGINRPAGVFSVPAYDYIQWPSVPQDSIAATGLQNPRMDGAGSGDYPHVSYLATRLSAALSTAAEPLQALLVADGNPCYALPDSAAVKAAFDKIPFVVSFSSFMDETAMQADLILPNHFFLERFEDVPVTASLVRQTIGLCRPVVAPQLDTQHLGDSIIQTAQAIGGTVAEALAWPDYTTCLNESLDQRWNDLEQNGYLVAGEDASTGWNTAFGTPSGKFALMNQTIRAIYLAEDAVPEGDAGNYPLLLVPYDSIRLASSAVGDPPFMMKTVPDTVLKGQDGIVELNPQTASQLGLSQDQAAVLTTPKGNARVRVHLSQGVAPGLVAMPRGLGHTAYDQYLAGKGVNVNQLIGPVEDPASGLDAAWGIRAKLAKA
jgi:anaerobic selenocysteine-containing dehydrogenase